MKAVAKKDETMFTIKHSLVRITLLLFVLVSVAGAKEKVILDTDMVLLYDDDDARKPS